MGVTGAQQGPARGVWEDPRGAAEGSRHWGWAAGLFMSGNGVFSFLNHRVRLEKAFDKIIESNL